ncbi:MAG: hypothetical protein U0361_02850 [Nitrospiraceae bacterium]
MRFLIAGNSGGADDPIQLGAPLPNDSIGLPDGVSGHHDSRAAGDACRGHQFEFSHRQVDRVVFSFELLLHVFSWNG